MQTALRGLAKVLMGMVCVVGSMTPAQAGKAHVHGQARMDVAVEGGHMTIELEIPQDSLVGFERTARTPAERQQAQRALTRLQEEGLLKPSPPAGCVQRSVDVQAPALTQTTGAAPGQEHADVSFRWAFVCQHPQQLRALDVGLFAAFGRLQRVDVQAVGATGQRKAVLRRSATVLQLVP
ncbi:DUF2796 domain-containing protein [Limnohabitans sp.]|uniref:ZrgA family zinc uptake protein n=1 Tax=Limnohabitans sp. TaxID=1907725 RepID=UPI003919C83D